MNSIDAQRLIEQLRQRGLGHLLLDVYDRVASTQSTLQQRSERDDIHGHVVVAAMQTHGRGRRGKTWVSRRRATSMPVLGGGGRAAKVPLVR